MSRRTWILAVRRASFWMLPSLSALMLVLTLDAAAGRSLSACTLQSGTNNTTRFGGISHSDINWQGDTRAVRANLWNYNPTPIFQVTAFWAMVNDQSSATRHAQTGWAKFSNQNVEAIFAEWDNGAGFTRRWYKASTDEWVTMPTTQPSSSIKYNARWLDLSGANEQVQMSIILNGGAESSILTGIVTWAANTYQVSSETQNFATASPTNKGDHASGDNSNHIHADNIEYYDISGWHAAHTPLTFLTPAGNHSTETQGVSGVGFRVWDNRCND